MNGQDIITTSNANIDLAPNGTGKVVVKGNTNPGTVVFNCEANSHGQTVKSQPHTANVTNELTLPAGGDQEIVGTTATQTLENKTLTTPIIAEIDASSNFTLDAGGNIEINADGGTITFKDGASSLGTITSSGYSGTAAVATTVTVSDSNANTNFPVVFHDESNALLDDTGALRYNPSTGTLLVPNLSVAGTTTTVDTVTMQAQNAIIFEGATADANETTLTIVDPTADRTINLPNVSGTIPVLAAVSTTQISATPEELNIMDGVTATTSELNIMDGVTATTSELNIMDGVTATTSELNIMDGVTATTAELNILDGVTASAADINLIDGITNGTVIASKAIITDSNKDISGGRNITISGELDAYSLDIEGNADINGTLEADAITVGGTALNTVIAGVTVTDATNAAHVLVTDNESTNENNLITFVENATSSTGNVGLEMDGNLTYNPSTGRLTATQLAGTLQTAAQANITSLGTLTTLTVDNVIVNGTTIGHTDDTDLITLADGVVTVAGEISVTTLDIGGTNVTSTAAELNILDGVTATASELNIMDGVTATTAELNIMDGVTSTTAELNILDGVTSTASELNLVDGITAGTVSASKAVIADSNKDVTGFRNVTTTGDVTVGDDASVAGRATGNQETDNDGNFDLATANFFKCTPSGNFTLTLSNPAEGQSGTIMLINTGGHTVSAHASVAINADILTAISSAGTYMLSYYCSAASGNDTILVGATGALT